MTLTIRNFSSQQSHHNRFRRALSLLARKAIHLGVSEDGKSLDLRPEHLKTHLLIQSPTQTGKTSLGRELIRRLTRLRASLYVSDRKGDLYKGLEEDFAALRLDERVTLLDTSRNDFLPGFNPLKRNGLRIADHAAWVCGAIRSAWGDETFERTPQMMRALYNTKALAIETGATMIDALEILRLDATEFRKHLLSKCANRFTRREWESFEVLPMTRKIDATAPAFARLKPFCENPTVRRIVASENTIDLGAIFRNGHFLLSHIPEFQPLDPEVARLLETLLNRSVLAAAFQNLNRPPLYYIIDEAEDVMEHDPQLIETILNKGASLGIHLILIFHSFGQVQKSSPSLLASVLTNCRTKIIGGRLSDPDLQILAPELFKTQWHSHIVRDELTALELDPIETTRQTVTEGTAESWSLGVNFGDSWSKSESESTTKSLTSSEGKGFSESHAVTVGTSEIESEGTSQSSSPYAKYHQDTKASGSGRTMSVSDGTTLSQHFEKSTGTAETKGNQKGTGGSFGITPTFGRSTSKSVATAPFYEYKKRQRVSSRQFLTLEDFLTEYMNKMKRQKLGQFLIQTPMGEIQFFQAPRPIPLRGRERLNDFRIEIWRQPRYRTEGLDDDDALLVPAGSPDDDAPKPIKARRKKPAPTERRNEE